MKGELTLILLYQFYNVAFTYGSDILTALKLAQLVTRVVVIGLPSIGNVGDGVLKDTLLAWLTNFWGFGEKRFGEGVEGVIFGKNTVILNVGIAEVLGLNGGIVGEARLQKTFGEEEVKNGSAEGMADTIVIVLVWRILGLELLEVC